MRSMEFSGKTVDEAIFTGLTEMGVTIDEVEIATVQHESKGLFGIGAKKAIVRLTEREQPVVPVYDTPERTRPERTERTRTNRPERDERPRRNDRDDRPERTRAPREDRAERPAPAPREVKSEVSEPECTDETVETVAEGGLEYSTELAQSDEVALFLKGLMDAMQIESVITAAENDEGLKLRIESNTDGLLIGRHGETLDAIQYVVSLYANRNRKESGGRRVTVDTEGYRERREDTLRKLARRNASRVVKTGRSVAMEPMNPYERRILHSALQGFRGVSTHSEGDEPNRRVIITPTRK